MISRLEERKRRARNGASFGLCWGFSILCVIQLSMVYLGLPSSVPDVIIRTNAGEIDLVVSQDQLTPNGTLRVIIIGCNRTEGLRNTLESVSHANYISEVSLHICVDKCDNSLVERLAIDYRWPHGDKFWSIQTEKMGLAKHITNCWKNPKDNEWALFLEDDVVVDPHIFTAFYEAVSIRSRHKFSRNIVGIAMHGIRVNQYCWSQYAAKQNCQMTQAECRTRSASESTFGSLVCQSGSNGHWELNQIPSSWGAFYEGSAWRLFQEYVHSRSSLEVGEDHPFGVPHSMSNEWIDSWKRYLLELMYCGGWTMMYRSNANHKGFARTMRYEGKHTTGISEKEVEAKCLMSLPLYNTSVFIPDGRLLRDANRVTSYDYCGHHRTIDRLIQQGNAYSSLVFSEHFTRGTTKSKTIYSPPITEMKHRHLTAEIVLVTSVGSWNRGFQLAIQQFEVLQGYVRFVAVAPASVCSRLRRNVSVSCLDESLLRQGPEGLPLISDLLMVGSRMAQLGVTKWIGIMNGDICFDNKTLQSTLRAVSVSGLCDGKSACVLTGQRFDVDLGTGKKQLHSVYGMDYFIFNSNGMAFVLREGFLPPFQIGRIRWDSWLMGALVTGEEITTIDASESLTVLHYVNASKADVSKNHRDTTNLELADERYRLGQTNFARYRISSNDRVVQQFSYANVNSFVQQFRSRWEFDRLVEKATLYNFTSAGLPSIYMPCFCNWLRMLVLRPHRSFVAEYCTPYEYMQPKNQNSEAIFFQKEVFELISGGNSTIEGLDCQQDSFETMNGTCCTLATRMDLPRAVPGKFWQHANNGKKTWCI